jgi:penicillin-binding protein 1B
MAGRRGDRRRAANRSPTGRPPSPRSWRRVGAVFVLGLILPLLLASIGYLAHLDKTVRAQFEGKRWALPARVYGRPLELFSGMSLSPTKLEAELKLLHYRRARSSVSSGTFGHDGNDFHIHTRGFGFWDGVESSRRVRLTILGDRIGDLSDLETGSALSLVRLEPVQIGGIYPTHHEDRVLVRLEDVPRALIEALIAVEDRSFYEHHGVDLRGIARAMWANLRSGRWVQGGSTLTQQLVKNFFLSAERTLVRKINEALMAMLLELRYGKDEILEAYLNEIYLGQDGERAIHGFGLASQYYFGRLPSELEPRHVALLVALTRGPSYYNPRRHVERAKARRDLVLGIMASRGVIGADAAAQAKEAPLDVLPEPPGGAGRYPAFLDLVGRQLRRDYREEDLRSEGLRIFTTLDPLVQASVEAALASRLGPLERSRKLPASSLEAAVIVTSTQDGEVLALQGGRSPSYAGFNRALDAGRPIGSLAKPAVYLTALERPGQFTVLTRLEDRPLRVQNRAGQVWAPQNYDRRFHNLVPLHEALANSYNVATVRLGLEIGVEQVLETLRNLGVRRRLDPYPSIFLGAAELSPLEVAQMYQTLAAGGFFTPLRAIREVLDVEGQPLQRYPLTVERTLDPAPVYLLNRLLQEVARDGTGRSMYRRLPRELGVAGKTGTTDDLRDSWFAGFTGDRLAVVWLGRDDNRSIGLSGAAGALQVWTEIMTRIRPEPLDLEPPRDVEFVGIDPVTLLRANRDCTSSVDYPFIRGTAPALQAGCAPPHEMDRASVEPEPKPEPEPRRRTGGGFRNWLERLFR